LQFVNWKIKTVVAFFDYNKKLLKMEFYLLKLQITIDAISSI